MKSRRFVPILALLVVGSFATLGFAAKKGGVKGGGGNTSSFISMVATVDNQAQGVSGDTLGDYTDGVDGVQCYISVSKNDADLVTYNTSPSRKLHFVFDSTSPPWEASKLPESLDAEIDFFAINYYGKYINMGIGTTAQVQMDLEFKVGSLTYELDYASLAVYRKDLNTWLITSDTNDPDMPEGNPFAWSDQAKLNVIRRHAQTTYGVVSMPFRVRMTAN
ncbi:MAG TPA: hypothetical protein VM182_16780 [Terriglobia bacterium]|nr:hypothetical protein [Terriglobia bacterium]